MGPRAGLDAVDKILAPTGNRTRAVQPVAIPTELSRLVLLIVVVTHQLPNPPIIMVIRLSGVIYEIKGVLLTVHTRRIANGQTSRQDKQEVLGRTNRLLSFDTTWTA
jgi:hypothetical protein